MSKAGRRRRTPERRIEDRQMRTAYTNSVRDAYNELAAIVDSIEAPQGAAMTQQQIDDAVAVVEKKINTNLAEPR